MVVHTGWKIYGGASEPAVLDRLRVWHSPAALYLLPVVLVFIPCHRIFGWSVKCVDPGVCTFCHLKHLPTTSTVRFTVSDIHRSNGSTDDRDKPHTRWTPLVRSVHDLGWRSRTTQRPPSTILLKNGQLHLKVALPTSKLDQENMI